MASTLPTPRPDTSNATPRPDNNSTPSPRESDDQSVQHHSAEKPLPLKPPIHEVLPKEG